MLNNNLIAQIKQELSIPKRCSIICHRNPDGDAMGSSLGLYHFLQKLNHEVTFISPNEFPDFLAWLPSSSSTIIHEREFEKSCAVLQQSDLIFTLDFNAFHRTGDSMEKIITKVEKTFIMIDHHQFPDEYAKYTFSDVNYGSTCQMIYDFINQLGYNHLIDHNIATCLYTGVVTDSGSFRFPKTTKETHICVADLIDKGAKNTEIHSNLFDNSSYARLQLLGKSLQNLVVLPEYQASYITLSQEELDTYNHKKGDTEGIVNYGLSIKGINLTAIFIENKEENIIKISFRSKADVDVNEFARKHFNGGGHINAAGGKSFLSLEETVTRFITILAEEKTIL